MWPGGRWEGPSHLSQVDQIRWERRKKKEKKRKNKESGVRSSTFTLRFTELESSVFVGSRGKVHLRDESFT